MICKDYSFQPIGATEAYTYQQCTSLNMSIFSYIGCQNGCRVGHNLEQIVNASVCGQNSVINSTHVFNTSCVSNCEQITETIDYLNTTYIRSQCVQELYCLYHYQTYRSMNVFQNDTCQYKFHAIFCPSFYGITNLSCDRFLKVQPFDSRKEKQQTNGLPWWAWIVISVFILALIITIVILLKKFCFKTSQKYEIEKKNQKQNGKQEGRYITRRGQTIEQTMEQIQVK